MRFCGPGEQMSSQRNQVAIVTGGSRGIGRAIALALAMDGMSVVVNYLRSKEEAYVIIEQIGRAAIAVRADVSDERQVKSLVKKAIESFGKIDVLVNNAGAVLRPGDWKSMGRSRWERTFDVNLYGTFNCIRQCAAILLKKKTGKIINITSAYGIVAAAPVIAYTAAKAGVINLTRSFAKELAPFVKRGCSWEYQYSRDQGGGRRIHRIRNRSNTLEEDRYTRRCGKPCIVFGFS
jgi:3-oxoacyl-[acyl-carrier protein] reductase